MTSPPPPLQLKPLHVSGLPDLIEVPDGDGLVLGRAGNEQFRLDDQVFPQVSSFHARLSWDSGTLYVEDLDSKNGTQVNGQKIRRSPLHSGDVVQLGGRKGPKFVIVGPSGAQETISAGGGGTAMHGETDTLQGRPGRSLSATSIFRIKSALGIPHEEEGVKQMLHSRVRTLFAFTVGAFTVGAIIAVLIAAWLILSDLWKENRQLSEHLESVRELLDITDAELREQREAASELSRALDAERERLQQMRESLMAKLTGLEADEQASSEEIRMVRAELQQTRDKLEGGGSGFCISKDGWIITNAHVVEEPEMADLGGAPTVGDSTDDEAKDGDDGDYDFAVDPVVEIEVVFSGASLRHPAKVMKILSDGDQDLALLKVKPFAGLSCVSIFDPDFHGPEAGSEVWLFGFPLGKNIPQEGELLTASVFRGIVSRKVDPYLQVQAVVYPGNSGGPAVDEAGRVIGIVTAVQTTPDGQIASDIGYVIPVEAAALIWPPENE